MGDRGVSGRGGRLGPLRPSPLPVRDRKARQLAVGLPAGACPPPAPPGSGFLGTSVGRRAVLGQRRGPCPPLHD